MPLLEVKNAALIMISTVLDQFNFFSRMLMLKDKEGTDLFHVIMIDTVCDECKLLPKDQQKDCTHLDDTVLPSWKDKEKHERAKIIQSVDTNVGRNARESMGLVTGDYRTAIDERFIRLTFEKATRQYVDVVESPARIYVLIDPNAGGPSRMSIMSCFICRDNKMAETGSLVIIGIDYMECKNDRDSMEMFTKHIRSIRARKVYNKSLIIGIPENQTGFFHTRIEEKLKKFERTVTFYNNNNETKAGVCKNAKLTAEYVISVNYMLSRGLIVFDSLWFTHTTSIFPDEGKDGIIRELQEETTRYCYDEHGKLTGKINGLPDDLHITFSMACHFPRIIESAPRYEGYRRQIID